ncbi:Hpt domain-containing protein [Paracoccus sp. 1_MG-2023]|uniref:Hpt domain-containing protein n=1 Tax=unclassified Paracoccus (in: a-proteobacteria) TaxID=2688777 RepID=UPI001C080821|nr:MULTISPECIES: Hpt domain-containing protein [unclassified Paracoccus (in: a-proteobacteria)]MBU2958862.1 Hpt domain-containing protein [Paracoccus sp. C2R09]MDO6670006.1 Hpt domain-containing protein [Paracoccus sp. 1_MG-2023]
MIWGILGLAVILVAAAFVLCARKPMVPVERPAPALRHLGELHDRIRELQSELGEKVVPSLLRAAISDLDRHLGAMAEPETPDGGEQRRAIHSFIGILDTVGCSSLAERCRELQDQRRAGEADPELQCDVLEQVRLLRAELKAAVDRIESGDQPPTGG